VYTPASNSAMGMAYSVEPYHAYLMLCWYMVIVNVCFRLRDEPPDRNSKHKLCVRCTEITEILQEKRSQEISPRSLVTFESYSNR
jgi:hypothetical protein